MPHFFHGRVTQVERLLRDMKNAVSHRNTNLEFFRVLAAFGIVWFHTKGAPGRDIAYAGLPAFLFISMTLLSTRLDAEPWARYINKRSTILLLPWLFWSLFYLAIVLLRTYKRNQNLSESLTYGMLLGGTFVHLWYFTFCFFASLLIWSLVKLTKSLRVLPVVFTATVFGCTALFIYGMISETFHPIFPWGQWLYSFATIPIGFAIGRCFLIDDHAKQRKYFICIALSTIAVCLFLARAGNHAIATSYAIAIMAFIGAILIPDFKLGYIYNFSSLTLGIYILHPFVQDIVFKYSQENINSIIRVIIVFVGAAALTLVCKKIPWLRNLV